MDRFGVAVCVSIKCVEGETWVNSAFPFGRWSMEKHAQRGRLVLMEQAHELETR